MRQTRPLSVAAVLIPRDEELRRCDEAMSLRFSKLLAEARERHTPGDYFRDEGDLSLRTHAALIANFPGLIRISVMTSGTIPDLKRERKIIEDIPKMLGHRYGTVYVPERFDNWRERLGTSDLTIGFG